MDAARDRASSACSASAIGCVSAAAAQDFSIEDVSAAREADVAQLKPGTIAFSDHTGSGAIDSETALIAFDDWASKHPDREEIPGAVSGYTEPTVGKTGERHHRRRSLEKLYMYVAQARFVLDRAPGAIDLSHYVTLPFLEKIDPAIKHKLIAAADVVPFKDEAGTGNDNPDRKWCTGPHDARSASSRATSSKARSRWASCW